MLFKAKWNLNFLIEVIFFFVENEKKRREYTERKRDEQQD